MSIRPSRKFNNPDALSSVLSRLQLKAEIKLNGEYFGDWELADSFNSRKISFHIVCKGKAWLSVEGSEKRLLSTGDLVVLPHGTEHIITSLDSSEKADSTTHMICGYFKFLNKAAWPLLDSLPSVIVLDLSDQSSSGNLRTLIELLIEELKLAQPGFYSVVNHLASLMFVQVIRSQIVSGQLKTGLLAALFDQKISKALAKIHCQPEKDWTVKLLADESLMGRSSFSQKFTKLVGMSVLRYLTEWRMREAKQMLSHTNKSILDIANSLGYESDAAFRKSYKKIMGETPGKTRRISATINS